MAAPTPNQPLRRVVPIYTPCSPLHLTPRLLLHRRCSHIRHCRSLPLQRSWGSQGVVFALLVDRHELLIINPESTGDDPVNGELVSPVGAKVGRPGVSGDDDPEEPHEQESEVDETRSLVGAVGGTVGWSTEVVSRGGDVGGPVAVAAAVVVGPEGEGDGGGWV